MTRGDAFNSSPSQRRLWARQERLGTPLLASFSFHIRGPFDPARFTRAVHAVSTRHAILRTSVVADPARRWPVQQVDPERSCLVWTHRRFLPDQWAVVVELPAMSADVPSLICLFEKLAAEYSTHTQDSGVAVEFMQFAEWQLELAADDEADSKVQNRSPQITFPWERSAAPFPENDDRAVAVQVDAGAIARLKGIGISSSMALLAAWNLVLRTFTNRIEWGCAVFDRGRIFPELERTIGPVSRYADISVAVPASATFVESIALLRAALNEQTARPWLPAPEELIGFDYFVMPQPLTVGTAIWSVVDLRADEARFKLRLRCVESDSGLSAIVYYDGERLEHGLAQSIAATLATVLRSAAEMPNASIDEIGRVDSTHRHSAGVSHGSSAPLGPETMFARFAAIVSARPDAIAIAWPDGAWTYAEFDHRVRRLAGGLVGLGVRPEVCVGVDIAASREHLVAALAIMLAGGVYLPLSVGDPPERIAPMLQDARASFVLVAPATERRALGGCASISIDDVAPNACVDLSPIHRDNLAYCIFTSGSTGSPKGVAVSHSALLHYLDWAARTYFPNGPSHALVHTAMTIDLTLTALLAPLLIGGTVVFAPPGPAAERLALTLQRHGPTGLLKLTPAHLRLISLQFPPQNGHRIADVLVVGGEMLDYGDIAVWRAADSRMRIFNEYGPTEAAVGCCVEEIGPGPESGSVPIGRAIDNVVLRVLDDRLEPVPVGVTGELFIGGAGLARCYSGRPAETAALFIPDPFLDNGARLYRSGDLARLRPDGRLELLGRRDGQVKVRGYRVETVEVETALRQHPGVADAAVLATGSPGSAHLSTIVARRNTAAMLRPEDLRIHLLQHLPDHMVPTTIIVVDRLPRGPSGKIDRQALVKMLVRPTTAEPLSSEIEEILAGIWSEVLGMDARDATANFFTVGGDSIRAVQVIGRARARGLHLSVADLFSAPTIRELAKRIGQEVPAQDVAPFLLLDPDERQHLGDHLVDAFPAAVLQQGMLFHSALDPGAGVYHDLFSFHLAAPFDQAAFKQALSDLVACHPMLRASFNRGTGGRVLVHIHASMPLPITITDLCGLSDIEQEVAIRKAHQKEFAIGFEPDHVPLLRFVVHLRSKSTFQLTLSFHHAIIDGWSDAILLTELFDHYLSLLEGERNILSEPRCAFRDFIALEQAAIASTESREFWTHFLEGAEPLQFGFEQQVGAPRSIVRTTVVPDPLCDALRRLALKLSVPLKTVLLAAHLRTMASVAGTWDVVSCLVASGRPEQLDGERAVGLFINSIPIRVDVQPCSWRELIEAAYATERLVLPHRRLPLSEIRQHRGGAPISDVLFYFTDYHIYRSRERLGQVEVLDYVPHEVTSFPLTVSFAVAPRGSGITLELNADGRRFDEAILRNIESFLLDALVAMSDNCEEVCRSKPLALLSSGPETACAPFENCGPDQTVTDLFVAQAARGMTATAASDGQRSWSYADLAERSERTARHLQAAGIGPEDPVIVFLDRCLALPAVLLGIMQSGGVYVPIVLSCPAGRLADILANFPSAPVIADDAGVDLLPMADRHRIIHLKELMADAPRPPLCGKAAHSANLAYILHTSGSTGQPKAVMTEHRALVNRLVWMQHTYALTPTDHVLHKTPLGFDVSLWELLWPLLNGACLIIAPPEMQRDPRELAVFMAVQRISVAHFVPVLLDHFLPEIAGLQLDHLRLIVCSGEELKGATCAKLQARLPHVTLANLYGPTEAAIDVTAHVCTVNEQASVPIGHAISHVTIRILDEDLLPVLPGVIGELFIGGMAPARGYFGCPDLTAERFVPDPFGPAGARLYRSGDLARRLVGGEVQYCGRRDGQVKIAGVRVELGEIENALLQLPEIAAACATIVGKNDKRLIAYVVRKEASIDAAGIRSMLGHVLPRDCLPLIVFLDALPTTPSGKVDRERLPAPDGVEWRRHEPPESPTEQWLAQLWEDVLGIKQVSRSDNFFEKGGDSLALMRLASRIRNGGGIVLSVRVLHESPNLAALARAVELARPVSAVGQEEASRFEGPASFAQEGIWVAEKLGAASGAYHIPIFVRIDGELDVAALRESLRIVVARHPALRTRFDFVKGRLWQRVFEPPNDVLTVDQYDAATFDDTDAFAWARKTACQSFDLTGEPCWRARLLHCGSARSYLLLILHHIAADGWSTKVVMRDAARIYEALCLGASISSDSMAHRFLEVAMDQRRDSHLELLEQELAWWQHQLEGVQTCSLPPDLHPEPQRMRQGERVPMVLEADTSTRLRALASSERTTPFTIFMAAFALLLHARSSSREFIIGTDFAGREKHGTEDAVGCFVNQVAIRVNIPTTGSFRDLAELTMAALRDAYDHSFAPAELVAHRLAGRRGGLDKELFRLKLVYQPDAPRRVNLGSCVATPLPLHLGGAKWDLLFDLWDHDDTFQGALTYDVALYEPNTVEQFVAGYVALVQQVLDRPDASLASILDRFSASERRRSSQALADAEQLGRARLKRESRQPAGGNTDDRR